MMILRKSNNRKQEGYTPIARFGEHVIDIKTFFDDARGFKREVTLYFVDQYGEESLIVTAGPSDVKITSAGIAIKNKNTEMVVSLAFSAMDLTNIVKVLNVYSVDYLFSLLKFRRMYYRIRVGK